MSQTRNIYGLLAEFEHPEELLDAVAKARQAGFRKMDAYTPFPVHGLAQALGHKHTKLPLLVLIGGILGALGGFGMQYFATVIHYPLNIGGRPMNSWPAYIIITFELTILTAGIFAVFGMLALNGLPKPYHPIFNGERFGLATRSRFFLCIESSDPNFDMQRTRAFLDGLGAHSVGEVPWTRGPGGKPVIEEEA